MAVLVKLAYLDSLDAVTLLALRKVFAVPLSIGIAFLTKRRHTELLNTHDRILVPGYMAYVSQ